MRGRKVSGKGGALLIHRSAVPLLQQEKAKGALTESGWEKAKVRVDAKGDPNVFFSPTFRQYNAWLSSAECLFCCAATS